MKDKRLTVAMAMDRLAEMERVLGGPVMKRVSFTDKNIRTDDIILGVDPHIPVFYVCSPKQKLRVSDVTISNNKTIGRTLFFINYIIDDVIRVNVLRVADLAKFTESLGFILDNVTITLDSLYLPGGNVLKERNTLTVRLEALLSSMLCCMESDDVHTFEFIEVRHINRKRMSRYAANTPMRGLWGNIAMGVARY